MNCFRATDLKKEQNSGEYQPNLTTPSDISAAAGIYDQMFTFPKPTNQRSDAYFNDGLCS